MGQRVPVRAGNVEFFVEIADAADVRPVGLDEVLSFDGVRDTIEAIGTHLTEAWERVKPSEATVEFNLALTARSGKLTGLVVEGGADVSLKVTLTWKPPSG